MASVGDRKTSDVSGTHLWLVMMKSHRALARIAGGSIRSTGLGRSDFGVLEILLHKGPQPVNDIGQRIGLTSGAITTAIDRLEAARSVMREAHATDRRARVVRLTEEGRRRVTRAFADHKAVMDKVGDALSTSERTTLIRLLKRLGGAAEQMVPHEILELSSTRLDREIHGQAGAGIPAARRRSAGRGARRNTASRSAVRRAG